MFTNSSLQEDQHNRNNKSSFLIAVVAFACLILIARLIYLQVVIYDENLRLSESNRMRTIVIKANRGDILDRSGVILVRNRVSNQIMIEPYKVKGLYKIQRVRMNVDSLERNIKSSIEYKERGRKYAQYLAEWVQESTDSILALEYSVQDINREIEILKADTIYRAEQVAKFAITTDSILTIARHILVAEQPQLKRDSIMRVQYKSAAFQERKEIYARRLEVYVQNAIWDVRMSYEKENIKKLPLFHNLFILLNSSGTVAYDSAKIIERIHSASRKNKYQRHLLFEDATDEEVALVEENQSNLTGVLVESVPRRYYTNTTVASHQLGFTGEISKDQLEKDSATLDYVQGDHIGHMGLEKQYEQSVRGKNGTKFVEVDVYGRELGMLLSMPNQKPTSGLNIVTTIDLDLQKIAESVFPDSLKGSIVVLNPQNGEILVMLSSPRFDPNIYSMESSLRNQALDDLMLDQDKPRYNRAVLGTYPPGSIFKVFTAIAGLETHAVDEHFKFSKGCNGAFRFGRRVQKCWKPEGHGRMDVVDAIRESCDVYFYQLGLEVGMDAINKYARMYGLSRKTGIDLPVEKAGLLMDSLTYNDRFSYKGWTWTRGQILNLAIGQGELVTPLQMANAYAALVQNDSLFIPHLLKEIVDDSGRVVHRYKRKSLNPIHIEPETYRLVMQALEETISAPGGTGGWARVKDVRVGGKTGSAENPQGDLTHAWFTAVAPLEKPEIAIAVLVENAGHGGSIAAPMAGEILRYYFNRKKSRENDSTNRL